MLKITRAANGETVIKLSGRMGAENLGAAKRRASRSRISQRIAGSGSRENRDEHRNQNGN